MSLLTFNFPIEFFKKGGMLIEIFFLCWEKSRRKGGEFYWFNSLGSGARSNLLNRSSSKYVALIRRPPKNLPFKSTHAEEKKKKKKVKWKESRKVIGYFLSHWLASKKKVILPFGLKTYLNSIGNFLKKKRIKVLSFCFNL